MKVLNLYAGLGGNRALWPEHANVTAVENDPKILAAYQRQYPGDHCVNGDAHIYLLEHLHEYDFVWSSPPCQTHSTLGRAAKRRYPDFRLYEEIHLLENEFRGPWAVENVVPWYRPLKPPTFKVGRHLFWASAFAMIQDEPSPPNFANLGTMAGRARLLDWLGLTIPEVIYYQGNHCPSQVVRNCVHPAVGRRVFDALAL